MRVIIKKTGRIFNASMEWINKNLPSDKYELLNEKEDSKLKK